MSLQSEALLENNLIKQLTGLGYTFVNIIKNKPLTTYSAAVHFSPYVSNTNHFSLHALDFPYICFYRIQVI